MPFASLIPFSVRLNIEFVVHHTYSLAPTVVLYTNPPYPFKFRIAITLYFERYPALPPAPPACVPPELDHALFAADALLTFMKYDDAKERILKTKEVDLHLLQMIEAWIFDRIHCTTWIRITIPTNMVGCSATSFLDC